MAAITTDHPLKLRVSNRPAALSALLFSLLAAAPALAAEEDPWAAVPKLLEAIRAPEFPDRDFPITEHGARPSLGNGTQDALPGITRAIEACAAAGGGRVVIPAGEWFVAGPIHLKSKVNLHLAEEATVSFSVEPADYPNVFTRFEGTEVMNHSPLIYAFEQEDIAITGQGTFHGRATKDDWWGYSRDARGAINRLRQMAADGVAVEERVFGEGHGLRPVFVQPYRCRNILIEGVTFRDSPMWFINPVLCRNVTVRKVTVKGLGPNNDGCNPESTGDVLIEDCYFDTGDDCIAIKSGRDHDGRRIDTPSENIIIRGCKMLEGHGGVVCGSEMSGGVRNVFAENCVMDSPHLERALRIKSSPRRGGFVENIHFRDVEVSEVADAIFRINLHYANETGEFLPRVRNVSMERVTVEKAPRAFFFHGHAEQPIRDVVVRDCEFKSVARASVLTNAENLNFQRVRINGEPRER